MKLKAASPLIASAVVFFTYNTPVRSAVMIQPQLISTNATATVNNNLDNLTNQSGLSTTYQSGITDYTAYMASNPSGTSGGTTVTAQFTPRANAIFDFDLGSTIDLTNVLFVNQPANITTRVVDFRISISDTPDFAISTDLGAFTSSPAQTVAPISMESFSVTATEGRYVRLEILSNGGATFGTRFGEIAFAGDPVIPEPSSVFLTAFGLFAVFCRRR